MRKAYEAPRGRPAGPDLAGVSHRLKESIPVYTNRGVNGGPGTRWATQGAGCRARVGVERVADSGVVAARGAAVPGFAPRRVANSGVVAILGSEALRRWGLWQPPRDGGRTFLSSPLSIWGLWQFSRLSRCAFGGYGNRGWTTTGRSSRRVAVLGVMAGRSLPQPQFPQRPGAENCHNPRIGNAVVHLSRGTQRPGSGEFGRERRGVAGAARAKKYEILACVFSSHLYTLLLCERAPIPRWRSGSAADC